MANKVRPERRDCVTERKRHDDLREGAVGPVAAVCQLNDKKRDRQQHMTPFEPWGLIVRQKWKSTVEIKVDRSERKSQK
jgi:hypothetical protein